MAFSAPLILEMKLALPIISLKPKHSSKSGVKSLLFIAEPQLMIGDDLLELTSLDFTKPYFSKNFSRFETKNIALEQSTISLLL